VQDATRVADPSHHLTGPDLLTGGDATLPGAGACDRPSVARLASRGLSRPFQGKNALFMLARMHHLQASNDQ
jgi:hypothetical protein